MRNRESLFLSDISKYRSGLMAIAIFLIMLCHNSVQFTGNLARANEVVKQIFQCGVDVFFFLSGLGLYFSFSKDDNAKRFYKKRVLRLLPSYLLVVAVYAIYYFLVEKGSLFGYLYQYSLVSFFISGELCSWFVAAILALYLVYPLVFKWINRRNLILFTVALYVVAFLVSIFGSSSFVTVNNIFLTRVPVFLFGSYIGKCLTEKKKIEFHFLQSVCGMLFILLLIVLNIRLNDTNRFCVTRMLFLPLVGFLVPVLLYFYRSCFCRNGKEKRWMLTISKVTLEIYLVHEKILAILDTLLATSFFGSIVSNVLAILFAILTALAIRALLSVVLKRDNNIRVKQ